MSIRIGINGFGRIGRSVFRSAQGKKNISIVAINDLIDINCLAYKLKYDSIYGRFLGNINIKKNVLIVNDNNINVTSFEKPIDIPWKKFNVDIVIESTGLFLTKDLSYNHILSGAKYVVITNLPKDNNIPIFIIGVNHYDYNGQNIVSNASNTINCLTPIIKVINDNFGILEAFITNIYASSFFCEKNNYINFLKNYNNKRNIFNNIIPLLNNFSSSIDYIIPELKGKINGITFRVPTYNVSVIDLVIKLDTNNITYNDINNTIKEASNSYLSGVLGLTNDDVVSSDFNGNKLISIFDSKSTIILNNNFIKLISWYDNETGYSAKVLDLASYIYYYN